MYREVLRRMPCIEGIQIRNRLQPGDVGSIVYLHGHLYGKEYGFDCTFEPYVAKPLSDFVLRSGDREKIWVVEKSGRVLGSIAVVEHTKIAAQLRWLILDPEVRGRGLGRTIVEKAVSYCRECGYSKVFLWTLSFLGRARKIYESLGFSLAEEKTHRMWGTALTEQRYDLTL